MHAKDYWSKGVAFGLPALSNREVALFRAELLGIGAQQVAAHGENWTEALGRTDMASHPLWPWMHRLATHKGLLDSVEAVLGPNLLIRNLDIFVKDPFEWDQVRWHTDWAGSDGTEDGLLTAWLSLSEGPVDEVSGSMRFGVGWHRKALPSPPKSKRVLDLGGEATGAVLAGELVQCRMDAGQLSLHHALTPHESGFNFRKKPRIGVAMRFMAPSVSQRMAGAGQGFVARGTHTGNFQGVDHFPVQWTTLRAEGCNATTKRREQMQRKALWLRLKAKVRRWS